MNIHMNRPNQSADENGETVGEIDIDKMKRFISYCKMWVYRMCIYSDWIADLASIRGSQEMCATTFAGSSRIAQ